MLVFQKPLCAQVNVINEPCYYMLFTGYLTYYHLRGIKLSCSKSSLLFIVLIQTKQGYLNCEPAKYTTNAYMWPSSQKN